MELQLSFLNGRSDSRMADKAVFTRREVVEFILDLAGYTAGKPLHRAHLEPSMGMAISSTCHRPAVDAYNGELADCIVLSSCTAPVTRKRATLSWTRCATKASHPTKGTLCERWLRQVISLLHTCYRQSSLCPQELIPDVLMSEYGGASNDL